MVNQPPRIPSGPPPIPSSSPTPLEPPRIPPAKRPMPVIAKILLTCGILFGLFIGFRVVQFAIYLKKHPYSAQVTPGKTTFDEANHKIISSRESNVFGNNADAVKMASSFSGGMKTLRETFFTKGKGEDDIFNTLASTTFLTYCHLDTNACVFLIHVPDLRRFTKEAKESLGELAWLNAQSIVKKNTDSPPPKLVVGIKGELWYDPILVGVYREDPKNGSDGLQSRHGGIEAMSVFYPYFASDERK